jgi:hypothetical protein
MTSKVGCEWVEQHQLEEEHRMRNASFNSF